jgi:hypothetical protein
MALITGTPVGTLTAQESLFVDSAPYIYIQDSRANPLYNPDGDGYYWQMSGTSTYKVYEIGCPYDVSFSENITINEVLCDTTGLQATVQQRQYLEFTFSIRSILPLSVLSVLMKGGTPTLNVSAGTEKFGFGAIDNTKFWHVYTPRVYDTSTGDYIWLYFHKAQFVDAWTLGMAFGTPWQLTGIKLRAVADTTKPALQIFGMFGRSDLSVLGS